MTETAATGFQARADVGLTPPRTSRGLVVRPRLHRILEEGMRRRLTLVSAPPGYGKSVLLSAWIESRAGGGRPARLVLTRSANDPRLFWRGLADAVADVTGGAAPECDADDTTLAAAVVAAATDGAGPLVIVLDDFQEVRNEAILEPLEQLLQHAPDPLRLVIASRRDPGLGLHRLRLYGDLTELRACDLAFTRDEAEELLAVSGVPVEPEHAEILVERTGGWAAALRFVAISMAPGGDVGSFVEAFDRSEHAVSDYLIREVLVRQEPELRDFLLRGAVCDRMCGALADALTGRTDGAATLAALERDNVFVSSQPERGWYRFHPLFHELLRAEALFDLGAELGSVHAAAAQWLAANDAPLTALGHAVAAGDAELADELLGAVWIGLVGSGEIRRAGDLLRGLGPEAVRRNPQLCLLKAWERLLDGDLAECDAWVRFGAESAAGLEP